MLLFKLYYVVFYWICMQELFINYFTITFTYVWIRHICCNIISNQWVSLKQSYTQHKTWGSKDPFVSQVNFIKTYKFHYRKTCDQVILEGAYCKKKTNKKPTKSYQKKILCTGNLQNFRIFVFTLYMCRAKQKPPLGHNINIFGF